MTGAQTIAWKAPSWAAAPTSEDMEDVDEPPEIRQQPTSPQRFRKTPVRQPGDHTSLLTKAIMGMPDDDVHEVSQLPDWGSRRRSMASNISLASTADLTSDTGFTSPARTNTPSPPLPSTVMPQFQRAATQPKPLPLLAPNMSANKTMSDSEPTAQAQQGRPAADRKRSIQFACAAKPVSDDSASRAPLAKTTHAQEAPRRPCIKFACQAKPASAQTLPTRKATPPPRSSPRLKKPESPSTPRRISPATPRQSSNSKKLSNKDVATRPKFLRANSNDMVTDGSQFHEFACELSREDDWIRHDNSSAKCKLTIDDTLTKENTIRRLAKEAEEEADLEDEEEEEDDADNDDNENESDDDDDNDFDEDDEEDDDDEEDEYALSDGYHTDEETGFASSDESDVEENGNMVMWTLSKSPAVRGPSSVPLISRPSLQDQHSDSSATTTSSPRRSKMQRIKPQQAPDLPDSTDFVCGTLDEDRPLEEAYLTCLAARRNQKLRIIPQDIDPSFPASEPEDEGDEDIYNPVHHDSDDDEFLPGQMEDLHHDQDRSRRRRKSAQASPRRFHSPPPKRHASPTPKARGRSPKPLFDRHSPRRMRSPAPKAVCTPLGSPRQGNHVKFNLAARPNLTMTKSLPRPGAMFVMGKHCRGTKADHHEDDVHLRGAIDIVKGLERKRQRRKEKFYQKYCSRARRGQIPERRKPQPGRGAERMKELGLLMAGKKDPGNYVISI